MRRIPLAFVSRLVMALFAFQLLAAVPLCQGWAETLGAHAGGTTALQAAATHDHGGEHDHHDHGVGGRSECPETFLAPTPQELRVRAAGKRASASPDDRVPLPIYDVPTPVPIVL